MIFEDRVHAAQLLAKKLEFLRGTDCIILAIPRGGVVIGDKIAQTLGLELDIIAAKKITPPDFPEYAIGAVTYDGVIYKGPEWQRYSHPDLESEIQKKQAEVKRQLDFYRKNTQYDLKDRTVVLVDDGVATGATVCAILLWLSEKKPKEVILAVPVIPYSTYEFFKRWGVKIIAIQIPTVFSAVGEFYKKFEQVPDELVLDILSKKR